MSARDEGGAYARIRENLSELGLDAMAAGLPHWMSAVAAGEADFASAMLAMTSEEAEAKRRRGTDRKVRAAVIEVSRWLAQAIVRDGEGATKFITVRVEGGKTGDECRQVAYAIAHSPLVKTAFYASDPNLGRILAAVGYAGIADLDQTGIDLYLDDVHVEIGRASCRERVSSPV
mgnify:CR=1 FL=1